MSQLTNNLSGTTNDLDATFAYNPASQIASTTRTGDTYAWTGHFNENKTGTPNGLNQLTSYGAKTLTHDAKGNVTAFGTKSFTYSSENLLTAGPNSTTLSYDPMMRLHQTVSGSSTTRLAYDGLDRIAEYDAANALQRRYVHGTAVDEPLVWYEGTGTTNRRFLSADERGSIVSVTDSSAALLGINRYDEFGQPQSTNLGKWGYTGQAWLPEIGEWYYKARVYDAELGRFLQPDPIGYEDSPNLYAYVLNDPVNLVDPLGLQVLVVRCKRDKVNIGGEGVSIVCVRLDFGRTPIVRREPGGDRGGGDERDQGERGDQKNQCPTVPKRRDVGSTGLAGAAARDPTGMLIAMEVRGLANDASSSAFPSVPTTGTVRDAYRHFYGAFALTRLIGPTRARNILNAVEVAGANPAADRNMDTWNNHVAIEMAKDPRNRGKRTEDVASAALRNGCLKVNK